MDISVTARGRTYTIRTKLSTKQCFERLTAALHRSGYWETFVAPYPGRPLRGQLDNGRFRITLQTGSVLAFQSWANGVLTESAGNTEARVQVALNPFVATFLVVVPLVFLFLLTAVTVLAVVEPRSPNWTGLITAVAVAATATVLGSVVAWSSQGSDADKLLKALTDVLEGEVKQNG
jgi:hypothetical protein